MDQAWVSSEVWSLEPKARELFTIEKYYLYKRSLPNSGLWALELLLFPSTSLDPCSAHTWNLLNQSVHGYLCLQGKHCPWWRNGFSSPLAAWFDVNHTGGTVRYLGFCIHAIHTKTKSVPKTWNSLPNSDLLHNIVLVTFSWGICAQNGELSWWWSDNHEKSKKNCRFYRKNRLQTIHACWSKTSKWKFREEFCACC